MSVPNATAPEARSGWSLKLKIMVSLALLYHLGAVFMPPFTLQTAPIRGVGSPFAEVVMDIFSPYVDALYLNHGYAFFAPDPGPSHLIRAELEFADGRPSVVEVLPDRNQHWPRLLYHRHFMLSEHLTSSFVPPQPPEGFATDSPEYENWRAARRMYEQRWAAFENHLLKKHGADRVKMTRVEHTLLDPYQFSVERRRIDAPDTYVDLRETVEATGPQPSAVAVEEQR
jgi:hypothetical protein